MLFRSDSRLTKCHRSFVVSLSWSASSARATVSKDFRSDTAASLSTPRETIVCLTFLDLHQSNRPLLRSPRIVSLSNRLFFRGFRTACGVRRLLFPDGYPFRGVHKEPRATSSLAFKYALCPLVLRLTVGDVCRKRCTHVTPCRIRSESSAVGVPDSGKRNGARRAMRKMKVTCGCEKNFA